MKAFIGGGYRLGAAPEEESAYVAGERHGSKGQQDVSTDPEGSSVFHSLLCFLHHTNPSLFKCVFLYIHTHGML